MREKLYIEKHINYFTESMKYFLDKGIYLVLINIVPCMLLPFLISPSSTLYYLFIYDRIDASSFANMYTQLRQIPFELWYVGLIGLALLVVSIAITMGVIDRHMRVGEFTLGLSSVKSRLNYNLLTALRFMLLAFLSLEVFNNLAIVIYYLWARVFHSAVAWLVFSTVTLAIMQFAMIMLMATVILWPPFMLHTGLRAKDAFRTAWRQMSRRVVQTAFSIAVVMLPIEIIMIVTGVLDLGIVCRTVLDGVGYAVVIPFYFVLMYNVFYDVTGTERNDLNMKDKQIWSRRFKRLFDKNKKRNG